jgi:hypothetical protein
MRKSTKNGSARESLPTDFFELAPESGWDLETTSDPTDLKSFTNGEPAPQTVGSISEG